MTTSEYGELVAPIGYASEAIIALLLDPKRRGDFHYALLKAEPDKGLVVPLYSATAIEALVRELETLTKAGIIEVAVRNPSVMDYIKHWEGRTEAAEAEVAKLKAELAKK